MEGYITMSKKELDRYDTEKRLTQPEAAHHRTSGRT